MVNQPFRLVFNASSREQQAAFEACEADVFTAWFGNTAADLAREYGPCPGTQWLAVLDQQDQVQGVSRFFLPSPGRSKTMTDAAAPPWNIDAEAAMRQAKIHPESTLDFATCAVRAGLGRAGYGVSHALLYGWFAVARANACQTMTFVLDATPDRLLQDLGLFFHTIPGTGFAPYFGSPRSRPAYGHVAELIARQRRVNPGAHREIIRGIGLPGVAVPPVSAFAVTTGANDRHERGA